MACSKFFSNWPSAVLRGVKDSYAPSLYQIYLLVISFIHDCIDPPVFYSTLSTPDVNAPLLPATATSPIRSRVGQKRLELLSWNGKCWLGILQERGFDSLERWALKEVSDHTSLSWTFVFGFISFIFLHLEMWKNIIINKYLVSKWRRAKRNELSSLSFSFAEVFLNILVIATSHDLYVTCFW